MGCKECKRFIRNTWWNRVTKRIRYGVKKDGICPRDGADLWIQTGCGNQIPKLGFKGFIRRVLTRSI